MGILAYCLQFYTIFKIRQTYLGSFSVAEDILKSDESICQAGIGKEASIRPLVKS